MKKIIIFIALTLVSLNANAVVSEKYVSGTVTKMTSVAKGILIKMNDWEVPTACTQAPKWLLISEEDDVMISTFLATYMSGNRDATVYINATGTDYYCEIIQYQPNNL